MDIKTITALLYNPTKIALFMWETKNIRLVFSLCGLKKSLQEKKHPKKKLQRRNASRKNYRKYTDDSSDDEMTEEQMIAEDYYFYQDRE